MHMATTLNFTNMCGLNFNYIVNCNKISLQLAVMVLRKSWVPLSIEFGRNPLAHSRVFRILGDKESQLFIVPSNLLQIDCVAEA